jgi:hypothetical protein
MAERDPNANEAAEEFEESDPKGQPSTEEEAPNPLSAEDKSPELGEDEHEKAANKFLRALATAGRSFLLYDTKNDAIHGFLDNLKSTWEHYAEHFDAMNLEVRAFELVLDGKVVYLERDRERSLAFKLYRDGVNGLNLKGSTTWDELIRLLEILSIRYVGVRLEEDDIVTLLWKAKFNSIEVHAVEGYIELEEETQMAVDEEIMSQIYDDGSFPYPWDFDLPIEVVPEDGPVRYVEMDDEALATLRQELDSSRLVDDCLKLVRRLLALVSDPTDPIEFETVKDFLEETRHFLSHGERIDDLLAFLEILEMAALGGNEDYLDQRDSLLGRICNIDTVRRCVRTLASEGEEEEDIEAMAMLVSRASKQPLDVAMLMLSEATDMRQRNVARLLIERFGTTSIPELVNRAFEARGEEAFELVRVLGKLSPDHLKDVAARCVGDSDAGMSERLTKELLNQIEGMSGDMDMTRLQCMQAKDVEVRLKAFEQLEGREIFGLFAVLVKLATSGVGLSADEQKSYGREMVRISLSRTYSTAEKWIPAGLIKRVKSVPDDQALLIAAALEHVPGDKSASFLKRLHKGVRSGLKKEIQLCQQRQWMARAKTVEVTDE